MQDAGRAVADRRAAGGLDADQSRAGVGEAGEDARGVRAAADAGDDDVGRADAELAQLLAPPRGR